MKFGEGWSLAELRPAGNVRSLGPNPKLKARIAATRVCLGLSLSLLVGCASGPPRFDQALMADRGALGRSEGVEQAYHVFCSDVLQIHVDPGKDRQVTAHY